MAANSSSYDLVADLLSTNNTINVATLVGSFSFGVLAVYGCFLTWRHQQWERGIEAGNALEAGKHAESYGTRDRNTLPNDRTALEEHSAGTIAGSVSSSPSASSTLVAEIDIHGPIETEDLATKRNGDGQGHVKVRQDEPQSAQKTQAPITGPHNELDTTTPSHAAIGQVESITDADHDGVATVESVSGATTAA